MASQGGLNQFIRAAAEFRLPDKVLLPTPGGLFPRRRRFFRLYRHGNQPAESGVTGFCSGFLALNVPDVE